MTRTPNTDIRWRIQTRASKDDAWKNHSGLFETRWMALHQARALREGTTEGEGYGRGNVRVIKHEKGHRVVQQALDQVNVAPVGESQ